jgi:hypothetical protein
MRGLRGRRLLPLQQLLLSHLLGELGLRGSLLLQGADARGHVGARGDNLVERKVLLPVRLANRARRSRRGIARRAPSPRINSPIAIHAMTGRARGAALQMSINPYVAGHMRDSMFINSN